MYVPVAEVYRKTLRSSTRAQNEAKSQGKRQTPPYLRVIASPKDQQRLRLDAEAEGNVVTLKWDVVKQYLGSVADAAVTDT